MNLSKGDNKFFVPDHCPIPRKQLPFNKIRQVSWLVRLQRLPIRRKAGQWLCTANLSLDFTVARQLTIYT